MTNGVALINLALAIITWKWADRDFQNGNNRLGWINIFFSAMNAAAFASAVFLRSKLNE